MKKKKNKYPNFWSYSRWNTWRNCARNYRYSCIDKLPKQPPSSAMERGLRIHKLAEGFLKGDVTGMPRDMERFARLFKKLKAAGAKAETGWVIKESGEVTFGTDWANVWLRAVVDASIVDIPELIIVDYKTGRLRNYDAQMELYAWLSRYIHPDPDIERIIVELWFLDQPLSDTNPAVKEFTVQEADDMEDKWVGRAARMLSDRKFEVTPGDHCRWCNYRSNVMMPAPTNYDGTVTGEEKLGPCKAWRFA